MKIVNLIVALLLVPVACAPAPADPGPAPDVPAPVDQIAFVTEVHGLSGRAYARQVSLTIAAIQANGTIAEVTDPETGTLRPGPLVLIRTTPWRHVSALGPGIVSISMTAVYLGIRGEYLSCYVEKDGAELPGSRQEKQITVTGAGDRGGVEVTCVY